MNDDFFPNHEWDAQEDRNGIRVWKCGRCGEEGHTILSSSGRHNINPPTSFELCDPERVEVFEVLEV